MMLAVQSINRCLTQTPTILADILVLSFFNLFLDPGQLMRRSVLYLKISFYIPIYIPRDVASGDVGGNTRTMVGPEKISRQQNLELWVCRLKMLSCLLSVVFTLQYIVFFSWIRAAVLGGRTSWVV